MGLGKYKYYFRKPRAQIAKDILTWLLLGGAIAIAATSPYFVHNLIQGYTQWKKYPRRKIADTFSRFRKQGLITFQETNHQIYISLTAKGKEKAGFLQIDSLSIRRPRQWDGKYRLLIFDIAESKKVHREAFRGKLKQLGFFPVQKSVWAHPFECRTEVELLRDFFDLSSKELRLVIAQDIGEDSDIRRAFHLG